MEKGISLLGIMEAMWKSDNKDESVQYTFQDYVIKGYISQDAIYVFSIIKLVIRIIDERYEVKKL